MAQFILPMRLGILIHLEFGHVLANRIMVKKSHPQVDYTTFLTSGKLPNELVSDVTLLLKMGIVTRP